MSDNNPLQYVVDDKLVTREEYERHIAPKPDATAGDERMSENTYPIIDKDRDWPDDRTHYECLCYLCNNRFAGNRTRNACRQCVAPIPSTPPQQSTTSKPDAAAGDYVGLLNNIAGRYQLLPRDYDALLAALAKYASPPATSTHASRKGRITFNASDAMTDRECLRIESDGTNGTVTEGEVRRLKTENGVLRMRNGKLEYWLKEYRRREDEFVAALVKSLTSTDATMGAAQSSAIDEVERMMLLALEGKPQKIRWIKWLAALAKSPAPTPAATAPPASTQARSEGKKAELIADIRKDIDNICSIYMTVGEAMFDEVRERLACRIATRVKGWAER